MTRDDLVSAVERDFNTIADFARVCGLNAELIDCILRLQFKVRGLYPPVLVDVPALPPPSPPPAPQPFVHVHVDANTRWG
jgi:hypothetical protein